MKIVISPDENPGDPGAVHNGIVERDVNVKVAIALEAALKRAGQEVSFDPSITFTERIIKANSDGTQLLIACAHNAAGSAGAEGALFIFCGPQAHHLGHQQAAADNCGQALVAGGLVARYATYDESVAECCDFNGDTVYCEFAYETNPQDVATIKQPDYPTRAAELLAQGIARTYGFAYAPPVHPQSPPPDWKANLQKLSSPLSGILAQPAAVINTVTNEQVQELAAGAALTVTYSTSVRNVGYYMTDFSVAHETGFAIAMKDVHLDDAVPQPPAQQPPVQDPPTQPPAQEPPVNTTPPEPPRSSRIDLQALGTTLINWADHELVALMKLVADELHKRAA